MYQVVLLFMMGVLSSDAAHAGGNVYEATFRGISFAGSGQFVLELEQPEGLLAAFDSGKPGLRILLTYKKPNFLDGDINRKEVKEEDFIEGVNAVLKSWKPGQRVRFGLMGAGLVRQSHSDGFDATSNGLKLIDGVVYSFD
jgi:hypothetical protein